MMVTGIIYNGCWGVDIHRINYYIYISIIISKVKNTTSHYRYNCGYKNINILYNQYYDNQGLKNYYGYLIYKGRITKMMSFKKYVLEYCEPDIYDEDCILNDFYFDVKNDPNFPKKSDFFTIYSYLMKQHACSEVVEIAMELLYEYEAKKRFKITVNCKELMNK